MYITLKNFNDKKIINSRVTKLYKYLVTYNFN